MKNTLFTVASLSQRQGRGKFDAVLHSRLSVRVNREAGVTLMEVLVVIAIVGIMAAMAAPSYSSFIANSRISSASNDLIADLMLARITAVTTGKHVVVCGSTDNATCTYTAAAWQQGRIVCIPANQSGSCVSGDTALNKRPSLPPGLTVAMSGFSGSSPFTNNSSYAISYFSYGVLMPQPTGKGTFTLCVNGASMQRTISIDYSGRPSTAPSTPSPSFSCP